MKEEIGLTYAHRLLAPRPACLLTTRYKGQANVMTVSWLSPVSLEPPLVALAVHPATYTHDMLRRSEECVLNIPGRALAEQVLHCGTVSGQQEDKLAHLKLDLESGRRVEAPWIVACLAHLECILVDRIQPGDHSLFVAEIVGAWAETEAFAETWLGPQDNEELHPLCHLGDSTFALLGQRIIPSGS